MRRKYLTTAAPGKQDRKLTIGKKSSDPAFVHWRKDLVHLLCEGDELCGVGRRVLQPHRAEVDVLEDVLVRVFEHHLEQLLLVIRCQRHESQDAERLGLAEVEGQVRVHIFMFKNIFFFQD